MDTATFDMARFAAGAAAMMTIADRYRGDPEFRAAVDEDPAQALASRGVELPPGRETRIVCNTVDTFHVVMPEEPNLSLDDKNLDGIVGGISSGNVTSSPGGDWDFYLFNLMPFAGSLSITAGPVRTL